MQITQFKYTLKKYKTPSDRANCPACGGKRSFAPYIDTATGLDLPTRYGRCNRSDQCGYHLNPYKDGYGTDQQPLDGFIPAPVRKPLPEKMVTDLPKELLLETLKPGQDNAFIRYLRSRLPEDVITRLSVEYLIGNHSIWPGSTVYWFISAAGHIRAAQVKQFDDFGHTAKNDDGTSRTVWIHKLVPKDTTWLTDYENQDMRVDCLFGEHLLTKYPHKKIALFESPKTAIISAAYFPDMLCLAVGALDYLTFERVQALKGRTVILYPDLSKDGKAFKKWAEKAEKWKNLAAFSVSSVLESRCSDEERAKGFDMADFLERIPFTHNNANNQQVKGYSQNITVPVISANEDTEETNGWETGTPGKIHFATPIESEIRLPELVEAETTVSVPTSIDIAEYRQWAKRLGPFPKGGFVRLKSMADDAPFNTVFNPRAFAMGRLNSIAAWANARNDLGPKSLHIRQVIELRQILSNNQ